MLISDSVAHARYSYCVPGIPWCPRNSVSAESGGLMLGAELVLINFGQEADARGLDAIDRLPASAAKRIGPSPQSRSEKSYNRSNMGLTEFRCHDAYV